MRLFLFLFMAYVTASCAYDENLLSVEAFDEQVNNSCQVTLRLKIVNNTSDTLDNVRVRYFFEL